MKDAIDRYKDAADKNQIRVEVGSEGYPPDLQTLVKGVATRASGDKKIILCNRAVSPNPLVRSLGPLVFCGETGSFYRRWPRVARPFHQRLQIRRISFAAHFHANLVFLSAASL